MKETEWTKSVAEKLDSNLSGFRAEAGKQLMGNVGTGLDL
jgi:hypothetical protein